eukprot:CAMPEP_0116105644 /NCGR_PEP_ID=MMETSP0327-20121206/15154_1 /TAXON_ID=44447 /ORGANISM="Pseudo-nitzschia delicatissima, Strain B596" /LENGTH=226 /DNA_ID=CAMNT_0003598087 /DNA_START=106 /DNA_END=786 /DNA_ORIENTATION=-
MRRISIFSLSTAEHRWNADSKLFQTRQFSSNDTTAMDYFELFGISKSSFGIDQGKMKQKYLKLMTEFHPDKQIHRVEEQQQQQQDDNALSAEIITHAYQILKKPHTRAQHWLELHGCELQEAKPDNSDEDSFANPQELVGMEFLMQIMEWREAIEDAVGNNQKLEALEEETGQLHKSCIRELEELLDANSDELPDEATLEDARKLTAQLQYWHRLETTLKEAIEVE